MSNNLWFDAKTVVTGAADLKTSGKTLTDEFAKLAGAASRISALEAGHPAGTDTGGKEFEGWYGEFKEQVVKQGKDLGEVITELGTSTEQVIALFVKTDLESADDLKLT